MEVPSSHLQCWKSSIASLSRAKDVRLGGKLLPPGTKLTSSDNHPNPRREMVRSPEMYICLPIWLNLHAVTGLASSCFLTLEL